MAKPDKWMPMYWADFWKDTAHLSEAEGWAYLNLIGSYWANGGPLPNDDDRLRRQARCTPKIWKSVKAVVVSFFTESDNCLVHSRIERELAKAIKGYQGRKAHIEKVNERNKKKLDQLPPTVTVTETAPDTAIQPQPHTTNVVKNPSDFLGADAPKKPKPTRLSEDWKPTEKDILYATSKGLDPQTAYNLVEGFVNHWRAKPSKNTSLDWSRNWRTWVGNHINWNGTAAWPANGARQPGRNNGTADALSSYVRKYIIGEPVSDGPGVQGTGRDGFNPDPARGRLGNGQGHTGPIIDADEFERVPEAARQT